MKKLLLLLLFIPLVLFSQPIPISDSIRIYSLDPNGVSLAEHEPKIWYYEYILDESYNYNESRENFSGTRENLLLGRIEKNFDANGTLREELFQAATYNLMGQSYLRLFNKWGKLKVEILLNKNGFKDGIETFWKNDYNDYKPDPPLWKKSETNYSNGKFISSKTFAYKSDLVEAELILLNEQTESIFVQWFKSEWCYYHGNHHVEIKKDKNDPEYIPFGKTLLHGFEILEKKFVGGPGIEYGDFPEKSLEEKYKKGDKFDYNNPENNNFPNYGIIEYTSPNNTFYSVKLLDSTYIKRPYSKNFFKYGGMATVAGSLLANFKFWQYYLTEIDDLREKFINSKYFEKTVDLRFYLLKRYINGIRSEHMHSRIYKNGVYDRLYNQAGKAGKDRWWWANGNLKKEINYQTIEKTKTSFKEGLKNNPTFYLNSQVYGFIREWYEGGELLSEEYFDDKGLESFKSFYASGNLKEEKNDYWSNSHQFFTNVSKKYFDNGNLKESNSYVRIFPSLGDVTFSRRSNDPREQLGSSKEINKYNEDGILIFLETYKDSQLIARSKFDSTGKTTFKIEDGITYYLGNKVFDRNNNTTKSYFKNGKLASLTQSNKETRWFISGEKEFEHVFNSINNTENMKMWQNKKLLHNINLSNGNVIVNEKNKIETNNFLNYSRESSGVISLSPENSEEIEIFNSPYGDKIGEYNDYLTYFSSFQYGYEEYGIEYSDHINGRLEIGFSLWINDDVPFSSWLESTGYGNARSPGLVLRSKPDKYSKKIIAFQGESYHVSVLGEFINGYSKVRVDFYELGPCEGGSVKKSWEGWAKVIDDFGYPNIDYPPRGC